MSDREATQELGRRLALRVISAPPSARVATAAIAAVTALPKDAVAQALANPPCILPLLPGQDLHRTRGYLAALGLRVELVEDGPDDACDLCLHLMDVTDLPRLVEGLLPMLRPLMQVDAVALHQRLTGPDGFVIPSLPFAVALRLMRRLRRFRQLSVLQSRRALAVFDLFAPAGMPTGLAAHLRLLGNVEDPVTGAMAAALDRTTAQHLSRRFPAVRVVDRAFQRFDVVLTGICDSVTDDIADFLTARTGLSRDRFGLVSPTAPLRLDRAVPRLSALSFRSDYGAIGLQTFLSLSNTARVTA